MGICIRGAIIAISIFYFLSVMVCTFFDHPQQFFYLCLLVASTVVIDRMVVERK
jgi:predicted Kef-type K+ transport protein